MDVPDSPAGLEDVGMIHIVSHGGTIDMSYKNMDEDQVVAALFRMAVLAACPPEWFEEGDEDEDE